MNGLDDQLSMTLQDLFNHELCLSKHHETTISLLSLLPLRERSLLSFCFLFANFVECVFWTCVCEIVILIINV